jgi:hypothetical protein
MLSIAVGSLALTSVTTPVTKHHNELLSREETEAKGIAWKGNHSDSHDRLAAPRDYPDTFSWCDQDGVNYCTISLNQHIPQ